MGKAITAMIFVWIMVSIAGGVVMGSVSVATTTLTATLAVDGDTITVASTDGFADTGFISIEDEQIGYSNKTADTFEGSVFNPVIRGANGTTAVAHSIGAMVRTLESSMLNQSLNYKMAIISDASGWMAFLTIPVAVLSLIGSFLILPISFLGTDLQILTYIWGALSIGILVSLGIAVAGGRRV